MHKQPKKVPLQNLEPPGGTQTWLGKGVWCSSLQSFTLFKSEHPNLPISGMILET